MDRALRGSCACGRWRYVVEIPAQSVQLAELRYDNSSASRYHQASPLTIWLRVPLAWFHSATYAQFPDETHTSIQRTFTSPFPSAHSRRQFCGYCGTQLTSWHERTREDAEHILLTVGSLLDEDQELLGELGYLPGDSSDEEPAIVRGGQGQGERAVAQAERARGTPWFEELVEDTRLGKFKKQKGGHVSRDGSVRVEWEVVEWTEGDDADDEAGETTGPAKRKIGEVQVEEGDTEMRTV
ncbi:uncharacterized protein BDZ99DRAFT_464222 [Mytilinidion resinicola]|uniref:CENP-V/GFA domain-containing protein n=1 Tax=Mytilinidion resinicola TaxID=574789 RepID=A0A6A6YHP0_9PEZI|nr:uncharacterized protein BDZ99DRAFT_464222 [Mytilinidion resinicola]KAF2808342.1 hypothetical protein BDZ99DRAFT_464222 [Mytilinidion resinicola]